MTRWTRDPLRTSPTPRAILITTRFADVSQVHVVANPTGDRRQLTFFKEPIGTALACPDPTLHAGFLYLKDAGGTERYQVYFFEYETGLSLLQTDGVSRNGGVLWNNAGSGFAYYSTGRNGQDWDVRVAHLDPVTHKKASDVELITLGGGGWWQPTSWNDDDSKLLIRRYLSAGSSTLHVVDVKTKEMK